MNTFFEQSRSHWVRYERYEIKTGKDGKKYITPAKDARPDVYNPLKEAPDIVLDALNVGMLMMNGKKSSEPEVEKAILEFITHYGLLGLMTALPTTPSFMDSTPFLTTSSSEFYVGADYKNGGLLAGVGIELLSLKPRTESIVNTDKYKVDERITTLSYEAHVKYTNKDWFIAAKSVLGSNLTQASGLGGFGIKSVNEQTGEQEYTPIRFSSSWFNVVYGQKWKPGIFVGYAKNLGTSDALYAPKGNDAKLYGTGTDLNQLVTAGAELTYNVPHWKFGLEYTLSSAWYGSLNTSNGKIQDTHAVCNNRIVAVAMFMF